MNNSNKYFMVGGSAHVNIGVGAWGENASSQFGVEYDVGKIIMQLRKEVDKMEAACDGGSSNSSLQLQLTDKLLKQLESNPDDKVSILKIINDAASTITVGSVLFSVFEVIKNMMK